MTVFKPFWIRIQIDRFRASLDPGPDVLNQMVHCSPELIHLQREIE
jgi:hypothetical protein